MPRTNVRQRANGIKRRLVTIHSNIWPRRWSGDNRTPTSTKRLPPLCDSARNTRPRMPHPWGTQSCRVGEGAASAKDFYLSQMTQITQIFGWRDVYRPSPTLGDLRRWSTSRGGGSGWSDGGGRNKRDARNRLAHRAVAHKSVAWNMPLCDTQ